MKRIDVRRDDSLITTYDAKLNEFLYMDVALYAWLIKVQISGFKQKTTGSKRGVKLPKLPIVYD